MENRTFRFVSLLLPEVLFACAMRQNSRTIRSYYLGMFPARINILCCLKNAKVQGHCTVCQNECQVKVSLLWNEVHLPLSISQHPNMSSTIMKSFLIAITLIASLANVIEAIEATDQRSVCDACVADISGLHSHLTASNNLRDKMQLRSSLCGPMPIASQGMCEQAVEQIVPSLEIKLRNSALVSL